MEVDIDRLLRAIAARDGGRLGGEAWRGLASLVHHADMGNE